MSSFGNANRNGTGMGGTGNQQRILATFTPKSVYVTLTRLCIARPVYHAWGLPLSLLLS